MTPRKRPTKAQMRLVLERQGGLCGCGCMEALRAPLEWDHVLPLALGGSNDDGNWQALKRLCHLRKTKDDLGAIAKANRMRKRHLGLVRSKHRMVSRPFDRRFKRRLDGTVVPKLKGAARANELPQHSGE